jgi:hypothetical protein
MTDYNDGKWHGWNGGECPVHPKSIVDIATHNGPNFPDSKAGNVGGWDVGHFNPIVAFRVVTPYVEPVEYTGECSAYHYTGQTPMLADLPPGNGIIAGRYTATHINGKLARIVWEATE